MAKAETLSAIADTRITTPPPCWCGANRFTFIREVRKFTSYGRSFDFSLHRCVACGTVRTFPLPPSWGSFNEYDQVGTPSEQAFREILYTEFAQKMLQFITATVGQSHGSVLDAGCGRGTLVHVLQQHGFDAEGFDLDPERVAYARKLYGIPVWVGNIMDASVPAKRQYDLIVFSHLLEHIPDPVQLLTLAHRYLRPGGRVVIDIPYYDSFMRRLLGRRWYPYMPHEHYWFYTLDSLKELLHRSGFAFDHAQRGNNNYQPAQLLHAQVLRNPRFARAVYRLEDTVFGRLLGVGDSLKVSGVLSRTSA